MRSTRLRWAAVLHGTFSLAELEAAAGRAVGTAPATLADAGFLIRDHTGERWMFAQPIVRDAVYRSLGEGDRVRRHDTIADVLPDSASELRASHLAAARRWADAAHAISSWRTVGLSPGAPRRRSRLRTARWYSPGEATDRDWRARRRPRGS
jgi:hypothetical protein